MTDILTGRVWKYGDNINTDIISPPAFMELPIAEAAKHAMSPIDPTFGSGVQKGDCFVAEHNLGSGSSRETAPLTLKALGIQVLVAASFARIFYRNSINIGLLALECPRSAEIAAGDSIEIHLSENVILDLTTGARLPFSPMPEHILKLIEAGGLIPYLEQYRLS
ncbi:MAG: 3-isopropylmalate dehydratase [Oscillospiraceae bacterium]